MAFRAGLEPGGLLFVSFYIVVYVVIKQKQIYLDSLQIWISLQEDQENYHWLDVKPVFKMLNEKSKQHTAARVPKNHQAADLLLIRWYDHCQSSHACKLQHNVKATHIILQQWGKKKMGTIL